MDEFPDLSQLSPQEVQSIALTHQHPDYRWQAIQLLKEEIDLDIILQIVRQEELTSLREEALERLSDPKNIVKAVVGLQDLNVKRSIISRLTGNESALRDFYQMEPTWNLRMMILAKCEDENTLFLAAKEDTHFAVRKYAIEKLPDAHKGLTILDKNEKDEEVREVIKLKLEK